jgi:hypothetical protein
MAPPVPIPDSENVLRIGPSSFVRLAPRPLPIDRSVTASRSGRRRIAAPRLNVPGAFLSSLGHSKF